MVWLIHNTTIKKWFGEIFGVNFLTQNTADVTPIVSVEPALYLITAYDSTGTIWTAPTDKDFFVTNIAITSTGTTTGAGLHLTPYEQAEKNIYCQALADGVLTGSGCNSISIEFPKRGIRLERGSVIRTDPSDVHCSFVVAGYFGDDRS